MSSSRDQISLTGRPAPAWRAAPRSARSPAARAGRSRRREELVDLHLGERQPRRLGGGRERRVAVLRADPDLAAVGVDQRRAVHRLQRRVVEERRAVGRLDRLGRARDRRRGVAAAIADTGIVGIQALTQPRRQCPRWTRSVRRLAPGDRQLLQRRIRLPPRIGNHRDRGSPTGSTCRTPGMRDRLRVEAHQLRAEHRALCDATPYSMPGSFTSIANCAVPFSFSSVSSRGKGWPMMRPLRLRLKRDVRGHRQLRRVLGKLAVAQPPSPLITPPSSVRHAETGTPQRCAAACISMARAAAPPWRT